VAIEAGGDQHQLGPEALRSRLQRRRQRLLHGAAIAAGGQRPVDREAEPRPLTPLTGAAAAGIAALLMHAHIEHAGVAPEDRLGAVAVVHVPVDDQHPLQPVLRLGMAGRQGDVVEDAEAHAPLRLGVVAGWAQGGERPLYAAAEHRIHRHQGSAGGQPRHILAVVAEGSVAGGEFRQPVGHIAPQRVEVALAVAAPQLRVADRPGGERPAALAEPPGGQGRLQRLQPRRRLRMAAAGVVVAEGRIQHQPGGVHRPAPAQRFSHNR